MPIGELEGLEWQICLFDTMPEAQQLAQLRETLAQERSGGHQAGADARRLVDAAMSSRLARLMERGGA